MIDKFLVTIQMTGKDGQSLGSGSLLIDMAEAEGWTEDMVANVSLIAKAFEDLSKSFSVVTDGMSNGYSIQSIVRLTDGDEVIETTTQHLQDLNTEYERHNKAYIKYANDMKLSITEIIQGVKSGDLKDKGLIDKLDLLLNITNEHSIEEEVEIQA